MEAPKASCIPALCSALRAGTSVENSINCFLSWWLSGNSKRERSCYHGPNLLTSSFRINDLSTKLKERKPKNIKQLQYKQFIKIKNNPKAHLPSDHLHLPIGSMAVWYCSSGTPLAAPGKPQPTKPRSGVLDFFDHLDDLRLILLMILIILMWSFYHVESCYINHVKLFFHSFESAPCPMFHGSRLDPSH